MSVANASGTTPCIMMIYNNLKEERYVYLLLPHITHTILVVAGHMMCVVQNVAIALCSND